MRRRGEVVSQLPRLRQKDIDFAGLDNPVNWHCQRKLA